MSRQLRPEGYAGRRRTNNNQHPNSDNGSVRQQSNQQQHNRASTGTPGNASIQQQNQLVNGSHTSGSPNTHMSTLQRQLHQNIDIHAVQQQQIFSPLIYDPLTHPSGFEQNNNIDQQISHRNEQGHQLPSYTWHPSSRIPSSIKSNPHGGGNKQALLHPNDLISVPDHRYQYNDNISIEAIKEDIQRMHIPTPTSSHHSNHGLARTQLFVQRDPSIESSIAPQYTSQIGTGNMTNSQMYMSDSSIHNNSDNISNHDGGRFVHTQYQINQRLERRVEGLTQKLNNMMAVQQSNLNNNQSVSADLSSIGNVSEASRIGSIVSIQNSSNKKKTHRGSRRRNKNKSSTCSNISPSPSHSERVQNREPIDILPRYTTYNGTEMVTCPVLLQPNDVVYWQYSQDMMISVQILETTRPTLMRRQPIYLAQLCTSGKQHEVRHDDLFITKDKATSLDQTGIINANTSVLTATDRLDMHALGGKISPAHMQRWSSMRSDTFKFSNFQTALDSLSLEGDSLIDIKSLHESLSIMLTSASKGATFSLPPLNELTPTITLRDIIMPPASYRHIEIAQAFYNLIARMIATRITKDSFTGTNAPRSKSIILSVANGNLDGFDQLNHLYKEMVPFLGSIHFDTQEEIAKLVIKDGMSTVEFIALAQNTKLQLDLSGIATDKNALLKQFFTQIMQTNLQTLLAHKNHDFQQFRKSTGNNQEYTAETIQSLAEFILSGSPPTVLKLTDRELELDTPSDHNVNNPSPFATSTRNSNPSNPTFHRPKYAAALANSLDEDDATVQNDIDTLNPTDEEKAAVEEMIKPFFAALSKAMNDEQKQALYSDLYFTAISQKRHRVQCEACLGNHETDQCRARGPNFQDAQLRKRVEQVNAKYGDTPKRPPVPSTPPTASFGGGRLAHKAMAIQQPEHAVLHEADDDSHELQYHSLQNSADIEATISKISDELEQSVAHDKLLVNPKLAILELAENESSNKITNDLSETRDLADAMQVGDYSVYNEQVNC